MVKCSFTPQEGKLKSLQDQPSLLPQRTQHKRPIAAVDDPQTSHREKKRRPCDPAAQDIVHEAVTSRKGNDAIKFWVEEQRWPAGYIYSNGYMFSNVDGNGARSRSETLLVSRSQAVEFCLIGDTK
jgi:hypothetical protein